MIIAFADVSKAYDNVSLSKMNECIYRLNPPQEVWLEWQDEFNDLYQLNMDVYGQKIKRTDGLPQGSELSPALFNIYTTLILQDLDAFLQINNKVEVGIFADNWVIFSNKLELNEFKEIIQEINFFMFDKYNLQFTYEEIEIVEINQIIDRNEDELYPWNRSNHFKFLGVNWYMYGNGRAFFDCNDYKWIFPKYKLLPPFMMIKLTKRFIVPKFRYYYDYLCVINPSEAKRYLDWFKVAVWKYLQETLLMLNLNKEFVNQIIFPSGNQILRNFLTPYLANHQIIDPNNRLGINRLRLLTQLKNLAISVLQNNWKVGINQARNFVWKFRNVTSLNQNPKNESPKQAKRTWMVLDLIYYAIMAEKRVSTTIFHEQENYMNKTTRSKCYKIF